MEGVRRARWGKKNKILEGTARKEAKEAMRDYIDYRR